MELYDFIVKRGGGKNTTLDKEYSKLINNVISNSDDDEEERWETYNFVIKELFTIDNGEYFQEIKYRLTDGENPNDVILDIISRYGYDELNFLLLFLAKKIEGYLEDDFFKQFY